MTRQQTAIAVVAGVLVALLVAWLLLSRKDGDGVGPRPDGGAEAEVVDGEPITVRLFYPGESGQLVIEEREIARAPGVALLEALAREVLAGPTGEGLFAPFPEGTSVGSVFVSAQGIAFVDLVSTRPDPPSSGSRGEMLSVYSIVNSVQENMPELGGVVLLWNGQQRPSFAGHLDTGRPLRANEELVLDAG
jgi:spore germination protein GerM